MRSRAADPRRALRRMRQNSRRGPHGSRRGFFIGTTRVAGAPRRSPPVAPDAVRTGRGGLRHRIRGFAADAGPTYFPGAYRSLRGEAAYPVAKLTVSGPQ